MEISIKNDKQIEELADKIISSQNISTNTSEVKAQIINLINDTLYRQIKNVTLSTIIKEQLGEKEEKSAQSTTAVQSEAPKAEPVQEAVDKPETMPKASTKQTVTPPADIFAAGQSTTATTPKPAEKPEPQTQPTEAKTQSAQPAPVPQANSVAGKDPLAQFEALGEPKQGILNYNDTNYNFVVTPAKAGALKGMDVIVVQHHIDDVTAQMLSTQPGLLNEIQSTVSQINSPYQGQTPTNLNLAHKLLFVMATKESLNDYVNDLDTINKTIQGAIAKATTQHAVTQDNSQNAAATPVAQPTPQATQPTTPVAPQPTNISMAKPF